MYRKLGQAVNRTNILLYVFLVAVPLIMFSSIYLYYKHEHELSVLQKVADRHSSFHALYIEKFFGETIGRMESLAVVLSNQEQRPEVIQKVLTETHKKDARFSGVYWVGMNGTILLSSNEMKEEVNISDRVYYQEAVRTRETQISEPHYGRITGRKIISIAAPADNEEGELTGMLIGSIQLTVMEELIRQLVQEEVVQVLDDNFQMILQTKELLGHKYAQAAIQLKAVPWVVNSIVPMDDKQLVLKPYFRNLLIGILVLNILYTLVAVMLHKRKLAEELKQNEADKLRLIGTIAASTAHEIRNPLTGIKGFLTLLSQKYNDDKDQYYFRLIQEEVDRINTIVSEMLVLGKPTLASESVYEAGDILAEIVPLIESEANLYGVRLAVGAFPESAPVKLSKDHLKQIILNLVKNALESMEDGGGELTIGLERSESGIRILIKDTGKGMPPEIMKKIFTPFFTMKKNGTGLGLIVCKRIVDSYGGQLLIESRPGIGTEVTIKLPIATLSA